MDDKTKRKIERYMMNAKGFLWGVGAPKKKKEGQTYQATMYDCVGRNGLQFDRGNYTYVTQQLIHYPGIEEVLKKHIIKSITDKFPEETLDEIRSHWMRGRCPNLNDLEKLSVKEYYKKEEVMLKWSPFFIIGRLLNKAGESDYYVETWEVFAGLWFEEIEPWLKEEGYEIYRQHKD